MGWREAERRAATVVPLQDSVGRIAGEMVVPYPPGIPVLMPGESITQEIVTYLSACRESGISVLGLQGADHKQIRVVNP
jgi:arginine decarboxylase